MAEQVQRQMTDEEAAAFVVLIKSGWLKVELTHPPAATSPAVVPDDDAAGGAS